MSKVLSKTDLLLALAGKMQLNQPDKKQYITAAMALCFAALVENFTHLFLGCWGIQCSPLVWLGLAFAVYAAVTRK